MRQFKLTNLSVNNRITIYFLTVALTLGGILSYFTTPKEQFPEIVFPYYSILTINAGTSPKDMENLVTRHIEKQIKTIKGIKKMESKSFQDVSAIFVQFEPDANPITADQDIRAALDKSKPDLPSNLTKEPELKKIEVTEIPIMNVNLTGSLNIIKIKEFADELKDLVEEMDGVSRCDIVGDIEREIQVNVDLFKMQASGVTFKQIQEAISMENMTISGGGIDVDKLKRNLRISGEFKNPEEIKEIQIRKGIYVKDIAEVVDGYKERESYARLKGQQVITLDIIKKSGANLILLNEKLRNLIADFSKSTPTSLDISITGDTSFKTEAQVENLFNTVILGFLVVVVVLMFFMGIKNAVFVGIAIPISMLIAFISLPAIDFTLNMVVLIAFILVLGIVVDNSIVVVENIYRHMMENKTNDSMETITKNAVGEVAMPVFAGTVTTIVPFVPLIFWPGIMGKFMMFIPITLIITLIASMLVAYTMNPVFAVSFMNKKSLAKEKIVWKKFLITCGVYLAIFIIFKLISVDIIANLSLIVGLTYVTIKLVLSKAIVFWQEKFIPLMMKAYRKTITVCLVGYRPALIIATIFTMLFGTFYLMTVTPPNVVLFSQSEPDRLFVYIKNPTGTGIETTDKLARDIENKIIASLDNEMHNVEYIITNVAMNAGKETFDRGSSQGKLAKISIGFVDFDKRVNFSTAKYFNKLKELVKGYPAAEIIAEEEEKGPPAGEPIAIEITGKDYDKLISISKDIEKIVKNSGIPGITHLKSNVDLNNPEITIDIDRKKAHSLGISVAYIGSTIRTALYGTEISKYREAEDEYEINLRLKKEQRDNLNSLMNMTLVLPGNDGKIRRIPISAVAKIEYTSTLGGIIREDNKRLVLLSSKVDEGYNANEIINQISKILSDYEVPYGYNVNFGGEQDDQKENGIFLFGALIAAIVLIFVVLVMQFNSLFKAGVIILQVFFSLIGVLLGFMIFKMDFSVIMSGMGIIAVAGMVVKNGIILIDYSDQLLSKGGKTLKQIIIESGTVRLTPVLLTAASTILGVLPLAIGMNINFITLLTDLNPNIYFGGDSEFWKPLAWTIIFGLAFATILTLVVVPAMYYLANKKKYKDEIIQAS